jgi:hypothetical protein
MRVMVVHPFSMDAVNQDLGCLNAFSRMFTSEFNAVVLACRTSTVLATNSGWINCMGSAWYIGFACGNGESIFDQSDTDQQHDSADSGLRRWV